MTGQLPLPPHYKRELVEDWKRPTPYETRKVEARDWAKKHGIVPAAKDGQRICLMLIDCQLTFCHPDFELYVGGRTGRGAIDDSQRICEFIYRNMNRITEIDPTLDMHTAMQIFHEIFWVDVNGNHPDPFTEITHKDVVQGKWRVNPAIAKSVANGNYTGLSRHVIYYTEVLQDAAKFPLMIWPYHAMLGSLGFSLVPSIEEACFFHNVARSSQTGLEIKGGNPLTENYSVLEPEVKTTPTGRKNPDGTPELVQIAQRGTRLIEKLMQFDLIYFAGEAMSHCKAWTIQDLLNYDPSQANKIRILRDCTTPVVTPAYDFTKDAEKAFKSFEDAGMKLVNSTDPIG